MNRNKTTANPSPTFALPKLKINGYKALINLPIVDEFKIEAQNNAIIKLHIHQDENIKVAVIRTTFQIIGWTHDMNEAFNFFHNCCIYTLNEMYDAARGKRL